MTLTLHRLRFWLLTIAAVVVAALTFSLGQWQLRRAAQKIELQLSIEAKAKLPVLDNRSLAAFSDVQQALHRQITLKGVWQREHTVFLDNRPMDGKSGFYVLTPLALDGTSQTILVQRGWVQRNFTDRTRLPEIPTPVGSVSVRGRIAPPPSKLYEFKGVEEGRIRQNIDNAGFAAEIGLPLLAVSMLQTGVADEGLLRDWAAPNLGVDRHYGYAAQWFSLCALLMFLYLWFQLISPLRARRRTLPPENEST